MRKYSKVFFKAFSKKQKVFSVPYIIAFILYLRNKKKHEINVKNNCFFFFCFKISQQYEYQYEVKDPEKELFFNKNEAGDAQGKVSLILQKKNNN